jgi:hypothetical protein
VAPQGGDGDKQQQQQQPPQQQAQRQRVDGEGGAATGDCETAAR